MYSPEMNPEVVCRQSDKLEPKKGPPSVQTAQ